MSRLWDLDRDPPALLRRGAEVRFTGAGSVTVLRVRRTGPLALVEDLGRPGTPRSGSGRSGAADRGALRLANRAVGNPEDAAGLEVLLGGLEPEVVGGSSDALRDRCAGAGAGGGRDTGPSYVATARAGDVVPPRTAGGRPPVVRRRPRRDRRAGGARLAQPRRAVGHRAGAAGRGGRTACRGGDGVLPAADVLPPPYLPEVVELRLVRGPGTAGWTTPTG